MWFDELFTFYTCCSSTVDLERCFRLAAGDAFEV